ncbi:MAG TPA: glycosyltransferase, partial [Chitinophagaceae bacterium]|nr:glycosyltransferase [Chitinophagaceae bacterium]
INQMYEFEGVQVFLDDNEEVLYNWADIICTHLDYSKKAMWKAAEKNKPLFHFTHNDTPYPSILNYVGNVKVVHNAQWVADSLNYNLPSIIFPPVVDESYKAEDKGRKYITLVNLNDNKGARYFYSLVKKLPQYQFLGVRGSYDGQQIESHPNLTIWPNTPDARKIYEVSKLVLMPSHYESWGRVASEAMYNGIPVICNPTEGLKENVSHGGLLIPRKETERWKDEIVKLMEDEKYYKGWSKKALKRAKELAPKWEELEKFLLS